MVCIEGIPVIIRFKTRLSRIIVAGQYVLKVFQL